MPKLQLSPGAIKMPALKPGIRLCDRVGPQSHHFFHCLSIEIDFLSQPVESWNDNPAYQKFCRFVDCLPVTNDESERLVRRTVLYANFGPRGEEAFQGQLQVVGANIAKVPKRNTKQKLIAAYSKNLETA